MASRFERAAASVLLFLVAAATACGDNLRDDAAIGSWVPTPPVDGYGELLPEAEYPAEWGAYRQEVRGLLKAGASATTRDRAGNLPLYYAARTGDVGVVELLLQAGAPIDAVNLPGRTTALHWAALDGFAPVVERLILAGAAPDGDPRCGETPLHAAASNPYAIEAVGVLLRAGARVDIVNGFGETPLQVAVETGNRAAARLLLAAGANPESVPARDAPFPQAA